MDSVNLADLYARYMAERHLFISMDDVGEEAFNHLTRVTRGHKMGSRKWRMKCDSASYFKHYKMRRSYVSGFYGTDKRRFHFNGSICNYFNTDRGRVYIMLHPNQERLFFFSGHFFDRLTQRHEGVEAIEMQRDLAIQEGLDYFVAGRKVAGRDPLLLDPAGEAVHIMEGGYAVGEYVTVPVTPEIFPLNTQAQLQVCLFKTFLSDLEISPARMEWMLGLYRKAEPDSLQKIG